MSDIKMLYEHVRHPHKPINVAVLHKQEQTDAGFNTRLAVWLTMHVGTMQTAYSFVVLAIIGLLGILGILPPVIIVLIAWFSQTFLQLVLLPVISVGQNVLGRKAELMAEEQFQTTQKTYHDTEQMINHLSGQDVELLKQTAELLKQTPMLEAIMGKLDDHDVLLKALLAVQKGKAKA